MIASVPAGVAERLSSLARYQIIDTPPEPAYDDLALLAASLCATPIATIGIFTAESEWLKAHVGLSLDDLALDEQLIRELEEGPGILEIPDTLVDGLPLPGSVAGVPGVRFYAAVPIRALNGQILGAFSVADYLPRTLNTIQREALTALSRQVTALLELRPLSEGRQSRRLHRRDRQQALLVELGRRVIAQETNAELMAWVVRRVARVCEASHCRVVELLPGTGDLLVRASAGWHMGAAGKLVVPISADIYATRVLQNGQPLIVDDLAPRGLVPNKPILIPPDARSSASLPITLAGRPYGVLSIYSGQRRDFTSGDVRFLGAVADMLAGLISQRLRQGEIESIVNLSRTLRRASSRADIPSVVLAHVRALMTCAGGAILLCQEGGSVQVALGDGIWARSTGAQLNDTNGKSMKVIRDGTPFLGYAPGLPVDFAPDVALGRAHAVACLPLIFGGSVIGALWVASPAVIGHDDLHLLTSIADIAASALYRTDLSEQTTRLFREHQQLSEELRRAERHLAGIVESASDLVISADISGRIVTWNRAAERVSGYPKEQAIGRRLSDYCAAGDQPLMDNLLRQFLAGPHPGQIDELAIVSSAGHAIPISWRFSPLQNDLGEVTGIVAVGRDLLEQRRLESQLFQAAKMASMGVMASGIGHELRNPLGIISASAQLAHDHPNDPGLVGTCLQRIHSATKRAALIIDNLLTFAQPGSEGRHQVNINNVLAATVVLLEHQIRQRRIDLTTTLDPQIAPVTGNPALLQQVFTNLILNACQAMADGGVLAVSSGMSDARTVEVCVRDEGCGINDEVLPHIFDPFFTTRPVGQGTGLGLAISYSIVQQHGGQIEVYSKPGAGSTFVVRVPVADTPRLFARSHLP